jgi:predicted nuclease with TOPRIM domain
MEGGAYTNFLHSKSASLTTWTTQLSTLESRAAEHDRFSSELVSNVADPLKQLASRYEEIRKSHAEYAARLEKERDGSYGELRKLKGRYDAVCQEVETRRKRIETSFDYGKQKAQNAYQQQIMDMHNVKVGVLTCLVDNSARSCEVEHILDKHQCHKQAEREVLSRVCP